MTDDCCLLPIADLLGDMAVIDSDYTCLPCPTELNWNWDRAMGLEAGSVRPAKLGEQLHVCFR